MGIYRFYHHNQFLKPCFYCCWLHVIVKLSSANVGRTQNKQAKDQAISGRASATEAVDSDSIPGRVKPKTIKIGIHSFPA